MFSPTMTTPEAIETSQSTGHLGADGHPLGAAPVKRGRKWLSAIPPGSKLAMIGYSFADQAFAVGGGFLANVALARSQSKEDYGLFALWYSVFTFLSGLHNAAILQPYTVYASGRYRDNFSEYLRLTVRNNAVLSAALTGMLLSCCLVFHWVRPQWLSPALLGLSITVGFLLSGLFLRRAFYVQQRPDLAAKSSFVFFVVLVIGLWLEGRAHKLDSFTVFVLMAAGWIVAGVLFGRKLQFGKPEQHFGNIVPGYWGEHWNYAKWILATAFVFQLTTQGYYWLLGGLLSAKEVGEFRAMYILVGPVDQVFIAISYLIVPALAAHYASHRMRSFLSLWRRFTLAAILVTGLFALVVRITGRSVVHLLYGGKYDDLTPYFFALGFLPLILWIGTTMGQAFYGAEKPKFVFWAYVGSGAVTICLGIPLVTYFGLWGAVYGMLLSSAAYTIVLAATFFWTFQPLRSRPE
jgi:O-antigen/teichoic acid export membrane protein